MEVRRLGRSGLELTSIGFGGGPAGWLSAPDADETALTTIDAAWKAGFRYFDTALFYGYGSSERRLGRYFRGKPREQYVLSSKVGRLIRPKFAGDMSPEQVVFDYSRDGALRSIEESLSRLGLDRIDIALIHDIDGWTHGAEQPKRLAEAIDGAYRTLADIKAQGAIRAISLGVNEWRVCQAFAERVPIDCFLLAGRITLLEHEAEQSFLPFCVERGIGLIIGGHFNSLAGPSTAAFLQPARWMGRSTTIQRRPNISAFGFVVCRQSAPSTQSCLRPQHSPIPCASLRSQLSSQAWRAWWK